MTVTVIVNIHNNCGYRKRRCRCTRAKRLLSAKAGTVGTLKFGYCTHIVSREHCISQVIWKNVPIERKGFLRAFEGLTSVTVYYHNVYDGGSFINKPLLIRVKDRETKIHWYENVGTYDNRRWWRIDDEAKKGQYPDEDDYSNNIKKLEGKLRAVACRLHGLHGVQINSAIEQKINCKICSEPSTMIIVKGDNNKIPGYTKYEYSGSFSEKTVLIHNGNQITYRMISPMRRSYYVQFQLDENVDKVSVYYWDGDAARDNPLLIQIELTSGWDLWLENLGRHKQDGKFKHEKWRILGKEEAGKLSNTNDLKEKLNILNCAYNEVVQIKLGETVCHKNPHYLHTNRISYSYKEVPNTYPVLFAYTYQSSANFPNGSFNISEFVIGSKQQNSGGSPLTFTNVKRLITYVSPCNEREPFLIFVESNGVNLGTSYEWYFREKNNNYWEACKLISVQKSPENAKDEILDALEQAKQNIGLPECHITTSDKGIKLDVNVIVEGGTYSRRYYDKQTPIFVTKEVERPVLGFFKNSHKPPIKVKTFVVNTQLQDTKKIMVEPEYRQGVENVYVYFWDGAPDTPILIGIKKIDEQNPKYCGKLSSNNWGSSQVDKMDEQQALDHQNCMVNNAIPIELKNPINLEQFHSSKRRSTCISTKSVSTSSPGFLPSGSDKDYEVKGYKVNGNMKLSRLTYNNKPTNIVPLYKEAEPILHLYYWKKDINNIPLLVEFIGSTEKLWYENLGKDSTVWRKINDRQSKKFYTDDKELTEEVTEKLNEVNCRINDVVQIDISKKHDRYCHHGCNTSKIKVSKSKETINEYNIYDHEPVETNIHLTVSSILYYGKEQNVNNDIKFPIKDVKQVTVYFPDCYGGAPVAIRIEHNGGTINWLERTYDNIWKKATHEFNSKDEDTMKTILDDLKKSTTACNPQKASQVKSPPKVSESQDSGNDRFSLTDLVSEVDKNEKGELSTDNNSLELLDEEVDEGLVNEYAANTLSNVTYTSNQVDTATNDGTSHTTGTDPGVTPQLLSTAQRISLPNLIIDIKRDTGNGNHSITYRIPKGSGDKIDLERDIYPDESSFYRYTHESFTGGSFKVDKVKYGNDSRDITEIKPTNNEPILSYSVWYWEHDTSMENPLLVEIERDDGAYEYHSSKGKNGSDWSNITNSVPNKPLDDEPLEQILDNLNCYLNQAVTMDVSHDKRGLYCCKGGHVSYPRISVDRSEVKAGNSTPIAYHKHSFNDNITKLTKVKYYDSNIRNKIKFNGLPFPITGPVTITVFFCDKKIPVLIYVDSSSKRDANGWYHEEISTNNNSKWTKVSDKLLGVVLDDLTRDCHKRNELAGALQQFGCSDLKECNVPRTGGPSFVQIDTGAALQQSQPQLQDQPVTIQLERKPDNSGYPPETKYYGAYGKQIKVTRSHYPSGSRDFFKFTHEDSETSGKPFKLAGIQDDQKTNVITGYTGMPNVTSVSAYYWSHEQDYKGKDGKPKNALLVEVAEEGGKKYTYYTKNKKNNKWEFYKGSESGEKLSELQLTNKLTLLNCEINDVVQIDLSQALYDYCHKEHSGNEKVKVMYASWNKLGMYASYEHTPNLPGTFNISGFVKGGAPITLSDFKSKLPIRGFSKVVVYFCKANLGDPLLIHVPQATGDQWFQKPINNSEWIPVPSLNKDKTDSNYDSIVEFLDGLDSDCKPPTVTIKINERGNNEGTTTYEDETSGSKKIIKVTSQYTASDFIEYTHGVLGRENSYFTVTNFLYNSEKTLGSLGKTERITQVSVFYWTPLEAPTRKGPPDERGRPLLVKVSKQGNVSLYYENRAYKGNKIKNSWSLWRSTVVNPIDNLEVKLRLLNCRLNNAVIIDINQRPYPHGTGTNNTYDVCEDYENLDSSHGEIIQVAKDHTPGDQYLEKYQVYKHTLKDSSGGGKKFHIVSFKNADDPINIGGTSPILDVSSVTVYMCGNTPLLIYIDSTDSNISDKKLWKSNDGNTWNKVVSLATSNITDYEKIIEALKTIDSICKPAEDTPTALPFGTGILEAPLGIGVTVSSVFGGAGGLTGLGWWAFKRSKGDPWVRQI